MTTRQAVAEFHLYLIQLLEVAGVVPDHNIEDLSVNIDYRRARLDVARMTEDGQRIDQWLCGFSIDPHDLPAFGTAVPLPGTTGQTH